MIRYSLYQIVKEIILESPSTMVTVKDAWERAMTSGISISMPEVEAYLSQHEDEIRREVGAPVWETTITVVDLEEE
jgi:hypothetical protein